MIVFMICSFTHFVMLSFKLIAHGITSQDTGYRNGAAEGSCLPARLAVYFGEQRRFLLDL